MASVMRRVSSTQIDCPNNSHTHTRVCVNREYGSLVQWLINESVSVTAKLLIVFFSFVFACMCVCDNFCEERAAVYAFRFCVCVCREESFALQLMGAIHSNLVSFEIKKINKK